MNQGGDDDDDRGGGNTGGGNGNNNCVCTTVATRTTTTLTTVTNTSTTTTVTNTTTSHTTTTTTTSVTTTTVVPESEWMAEITLPDDTVIDKYDGIAGAVSMQVHFKSNIPAFIKLDSDAAIVGTLLKYGSLESFAVGEETAKFGEDLAASGVPGLVAAGQGFEGTFELTINVADIAEYGAVDFKMSVLAGYGDSFGKKVLVEVVRNLHIREGTTMTSTATTSATSTATSTAETTVSSTATSTVSATQTSTGTSTATSTPTTSQTSTATSSASSTATTSQTSTMSSTVTTTRACRDYSDWQDKSGRKCSRHSRETDMKWPYRLCNWDGSYGPGWGRATKRHNFALYAVGGVDATKACCGCGGGMIGPPPKNPDNTKARTTTTATATTTTAKPTTTSTKLMQCCRGEDHMNCPAQERGQPPGQCSNTNTQRYCSFTCGLCKKCTTTTKETTTERQTTTARKRTRLSTTSTTSTTTTTTTATTTTATETTTTETTVTTLTTTTTATSTSATTKTHTTQTKTTPDYSMTGPTETPVIKCEGEANGSPCVPDLSNFCGVGACHNDLCFAKPCPTSSTTTVATEATTTHVADGGEVWADGSCPADQQFDPTNIIKCVPEGSSCTEGVCLQGQCYSSISCAAETTNAPARITTMPPAPPQFEAPRYNGAASTIRITGDLALDGVEWTMLLTSRTMQVAIRGVIDYVATSVVSDPRQLAEVYVTKLSAPPSHPSHFCCCCCCLTRGYRWRGGVNHPIRVHRESAASYRCQSMLTCSLLLTSSYFF